MKTLNELKKYLSELRAFSSATAKKDSNGFKVVDVELIAEMNEIKKQIAQLKGE